MNPVTRKEGIYLARDPFTMMFDGFLSFEQTLRWPPLYIFLDKKFVTYEGCGLHLGAFEIYTYVMYEFWALGSQAY